MLTTSEIGLIKATVPILRENGVLLTQHFYKRMFRLNPELRNLFNMGNQQNGSQQTALALSVLAYAENIENPGVLLPVLQRIGEKHTSLQIKPEQYAIVGENLLASIKEVLGAAATDELIAAWAKAYEQLADIMINLEASIYLKKKSEDGSWEGWRPFVIKQKVEESDEITSFYLYPDDGKEVAVHKPGQYISIKAFIESMGIYQPRQYTISSVPNNQFYRISVKRESGDQGKADGIISNYLHSVLKEGDKVEVTQPSGEFTLNTDSKSPVVFLSGGVGQTPFVSILEFLTKTNSTRAVKWVHGCRSEKTHAFKNLVKNWEQKHEWLEHIVFYEDHVPENINKVRKGRLNISEIKETILLPEAEYYLCGPKPFLEKTIKDLAALGVEGSRVFFEEFGPQTLSKN